MAIAEKMFPGMPTYGGDGTATLSKDVQVSLAAYALAELASRP